MRPVTELAGCRDVWRRLAATALVSLTLCVLTVAQTLGSPAIAAPPSPASSGASFAAPDDLADDPCSGRTLAEEETLCRKRLA